MTFFRLKPVSNVKGTLIRHFDNCNICKTRTTMFKLSFIARDVGDSFLKEIFAMLYLLVLGIGC